MSVPNADKPNEGILNSLANSATNAVNYVSESIQGTVSAPQSRQLAHVLIQR